MRKRRQEKAPGFALSGAWICLLGVVSLRRRGYRRSQICVPKVRRYIVLATTLGHPRRLCEFS
ncbi:hypothetical protein phiK7B1_165 [Pseudomonas phage phiK7B1]|nr:hypothetical protein phiK7B1_165 [Pseudomonas phage phiK7B1]